MRHGGTGGPGFGGWSHDNVIGPDANDYVRIRVTNPTGTAPIGAEMDNTTTGLGYGTYMLVAEADFTTLDKNIVFGGMFPYSGAGSGIEFDTGEISSWDGADAEGYGVGVNYVSVNSWYNSFANRTHNTAVIDSNTVHTFVFTWEPGKATYDIYQGTGTGGTLVLHAVHTTSIPVPASEVVVINMWLYDNGGGTTPGTVAADDKDAPATTVILRDFSFTPAGSPSASLSPSASTSPSSSASASRSPSASLSPSSSASASRSPSASASPSLSPSSSASASLSPSSSASASASPSSSVSSSPSASVSPSASRSPSASISSSLSPSSSASPSPSASTSPSASASPSASLSPSASASPTPSPSASLSPSASISASKSPSASTSPSASLSPSASISASPSQSPAPIPYAATLNNPALGTIIRTDGLPDELNTPGVNSNLQQGATSTTATNPTVNATLENPSING